MKIPIRKGGQSSPKPLKMACPHCGQSAIVRTSQLVTALVRDLYFACTDIVACGHSWKAQLSYVHALDESRSPRPGLSLPSRPPVAPERPVRLPANDPGPGGPAVPLRPAANENEDDDTASIAQPA